jgi:hypothetical protein
MFASLNSVIFASQNGSGSLLVTDELSGPKGVTMSGKSIVFPLLPEITTLFRMVTNGVSEENPLVTRSEPDPAESWDLHTILTQSLFG